MTFEDRELRCVTCGQPFIWTAGEQAYYADKHLPHEPRHCRACKARRAAPTAPPTPAAAAASEAVCSECGRATTVPFRPTAGRPVFCRACYHRRTSPHRRMG